MRYVVELAELSAEDRPQDPRGDGRGMTFRTLEHGGEYPDAMPQAVEVIDAAGRACVYFPVTVAGRVMDAKIVGKS